MHILVVEDEVALCDTIVRSLKRLAYSVDYCYDGQKALDMLSVESFDLVVLDLNLPNIDGMIRNLTLRKFIQNDIVLKCSNLSFNTKTRKADVKDEELSLTRKETGILEYLMLNQGRPVSQEELIEHVWDSSVDNFSNSIRVHISSLRKKLRNALGYDPIHNRISEGYVMEEKK